MKQLVAQSLTALFAMCLAGVALGADHVDSPSVENDTATDINDLYAWLNEDSTKLNLAMTIGGLSNLASFSDSAQYIFHINRAAFDDAEDLQVMCSFDTNQEISCWGAGQYIRGNADVDNGLASDNNLMRVFAGQRRDPFFMSDGMFDLLNEMRSLSPSLVSESQQSGCPQLGAEYSGALLDILATSPNQGDSETNADLFQSNNVLAIVVQLDTALVTAGGNNNDLRIWATTRR